VVSAEQAAEIEAAARRIIPTDDTLGAREARVIYFIDRTLATFATDNRENCAKGPPAVYFTYLRYGGWSARVCALP
jgi:hypothetical protein